MDSSESKGREGEDIRVMSNEYQCAWCKNVFVKGQTDEEAAIELKQTFPGYSVGECSVVCDICWERMGCNQIKNADKQ